jgi:hypothetical protein
LFSLKTRYSGKRPKKARARLSEVGALKSLLARNQQLALDLNRVAATDSEIQNSHMSTLTLQLEEAERSLNAKLEKLDKEHQMRNDFYLSGVKSTPIKRDLSYAAADGPSNGLRNGSGAPAPLPAATSLKNGPLDSSRSSPSTASSDEKRPQNKCTVS